jgi:8-oxo-dGTP diphosphatase
MDNQDQARLTTDCIIFGLDESHKLKVLLIQRGTQPYKDMWALPGGPVHKAEALRQAALRVLEEETGVHDIFMEQLFTFGKLGRDPRGRFVTVAYFALVNLLEHPAEAKADTRNVEWFEITNLPKLAFDHEEPVGFELLPEHFTMPQLQQLYETISGQELNKRNFRTRIKNMDILEKVGQQENVAHRPASLYRFDKGKYEVYLQEQQKDVLRRVVDFES